MLNHKVCRKLKCPHLSYSREYFVFKKPHCNACHGLIPNPSPYVNNSLTREDGTRFPYGNYIDANIRTPFDIICNFPKDCPFELEHIINNSNPETD